MAITLSALSLESISISQAAATVIGADLGTTVTVVLGSLSGVTAKKQVAFFHVVFNFIVDMLALIFLPLLLLLIFDVLEITDPLYALVLFHNIFNGIGIVIFFPMLGFLSSYIKKLFRIDNDGAAKYINSVDSKIPSMALDSLSDEIEHMIIQVIKFNMQVLGIKGDSQSNILNKVVHLVPFVMSKNERYELIKKLESEITSYSATLKNQTLSEEEISALSLWTASVRNLVHSARSIRSIKHDLPKLVRVDDSCSYENRDELVKTTIKLYEKIIYILTSENTQTGIEMLADLESINEHTHDQLVKYIYDHYSTDISTPLNVIREIYSSNKALINSIKEFRLDSDKLSFLENLPPLMR